MKAHSEKSMNVSDVEVTDEDGFAVPIKANNTMKERFWINRVASKIVFQSGIQTMALRSTMSVRDYSSRGTEFARRVKPARCHKREAQW